jgi:sugar lactone lactonase YvrE
VAGTGHPANNGDIGAATQVNIGDPFGVEFGPDGALYVTEVRHHRLRRVDLQSGRVSTVAGSGRKGYAGDGGPARAALLNEPYEVRFDDRGSLYFVEMQNHVVRKVAGGTITTLAGTGRAGYSGDGGPAGLATLRRPHSIVLDGAGNLLVADIGNHRIRSIDLETGRISTIAGNGQPEMPVDGQPTKDRPLLGPRALAVTGRTLWIALREGHSIWRMDLQTATLHHVAGSGQRGNRDGAARSAQFDGPKGVVAGEDGHLYVVDTENHRIRRVNVETGRVDTVAGVGRQGFRGDGGDPRDAEFARPHGICIGPDGMLYLGDTLNHRVRRVRP